MLGRLARALAVVSIVSLVVVAPASAASNRSFVHDFNDYPQGVWLSGSQISSWEVVFPKQQCGGLNGCQSWFIGSYIRPEGGLQNGLGGGDRSGPITAHFTYPVTSISVIALPAWQFNAEYTLTAFDRKGRTVGQSTVVRNGDQGLPGFDGFGYFPMSLNHLRGPACSFKFSANWLASSYYATAGYMVGTITVRLQSGSEQHRCP